MEKVARKDAEARIAAIIADPSKILALAHEFSDGQMAIYVRPDLDLATCVSVIACLVDAVAGVCGISVDDLWELLLITTPGVRPDLRGLDNV